MLDIFLFTVDPQLARTAMEAGIAGCVVDWEDRRESTDRSASDGGASPDTPEDLRRLSSATGARTLCRLNAVGGRTAAEVEAALRGGATDLIAPMIETPDHVKRVVDLVAGRAAVGIMIETGAACSKVAQIARVPVDFVYVGLLDLAISQREGNVFRPLADATASRIRDAFCHTRFGIGGVTVVDAGFPVPCPVLMGELARLKTDFVFARRSFKRDIQGREVAAELRRIQTTWRTLCNRDDDAADADHAEFVRRYGASRPR